jgi:hypothetical protein
MLISELPKSNCSRWSSFAEFDDEAFCLCPAAKCVAGEALFGFAGQLLQGGIGRSSAAQVGVPLDSRS